MIINILMNLKYQNGGIAMFIRQNNNTIDVTCECCKSLLTILISDVIYTEMAHHGPLFSCICLACRGIINLDSILNREWMSELMPDDNIHG